MNDDLSYITKNASIFSDHHFDGSQQAITYSFPTGFIMTDMEINKGIHICTQ